MNVGYIRFLYRTFGKGKMVLEGTIHSAGGDVVEPHNERSGFWRK